MDKILLADLPYLEEDAIIIDDENDQEDDISQDIDSGEESELLVHDENILINI